MSETNEPKPSNAPGAPPTDDAPGASARPAYEPPRILKKRSVSRATLFSGGGGGPDPGIGLVGNG
jgi:hypothetical protein